MKIVKLTSENVKRLSAVEITPEGALVTIGGMNEAGKSSVLDSIFYALGGAGAAPGVPVRKGRKRAEITLDLGDLIVRRTFTAAGGTGLSVMGKDGKKFASPQTVLDSLTGRLCFDPLAFARAGMVEQARTLQQVAQVNFEKLNGRKQAAYDERTAVNREIKALQARLAAMPEDFDAPKEEVSPAALVDKLKEANDKNRYNAEARRQATDLDAYAKNLAASARQLEEEKDRLLQAIQAIDKRIAARGTECQMAEAKAKAALEATSQLKDIDTAPIAAAITDSEAMNRRYRQAQTRAATAGELREKLTAAEKLSRTIQDIEDAKREMIAAAKLPVSGLGIDEVTGAVMLNGIPFAQASTAQQIKVSVAIGLAANPKLKVLLIRDGSSLDPGNLALIGKMAEEAGAQIWVEVVRSDEGVSVVIEDGHVAGDTPPHEAEEEKHEPKEEPDYYA